MSDFYKARLAATYTAEGRDEVALVRHGHLLAEPAAQEWSLQTASYEYIAHEWAGDLPTGNARLTLTAQPLIRAHTRASLERKLRHLELELNLHRVGTLLLEEGFSAGAATLHTWWHAVVETANATPLPLDEAPPIPGAWGKLELSIILTHPSQEPPQQTTLEETSTEETSTEETSSEEESSTEESTEEETTTVETTEEETSTQGEPEPLYATGWLRLHHGRPDDDIGLYINGTHITTNCGGGGGAQEWADAINAANCGVSATVRPDADNHVVIFANQPGEAGRFSIELRDDIYYHPADYNSTDYFGVAPQLIPLPTGWQKVQFASGWIRLSPLASSLQIAGKSLALPPYLGYHPAIYFKQAVEEGGFPVRLAVSLLDSDVYVFSLEALVPGPAGEQITLAVCGEDCSVSGPTLTLPSAPNPGSPRT